MTELRRITERYRLEKQVASSDAGSVFRAVDLQSGDTVAVKLINSDEDESEGLRERFLETARALQALDSPCIPRVLDFGFTTAGSAFLVAEFLPGTSLQELTGAAPVRLLSLLLLVLDGLEALAGAGISPRNLGAENVLVVAGGSDEQGEQIKILGLGSAALDPALPPVVDGYAEDLRAFGRLAAQVLGAHTEPRVGLPLEVAVDLEDVEALRRLLEAALRGDPGGLYPSYPDIRRGLRQAIFGPTGRKPVAAAPAQPTQPPPQSSQSSQSSQTMPTMQIPRAAAPLARTQPLTLPPEVAAETAPGRTIVGLPSPPAPADGANARPATPPPLTSGTLLLSTPWSAAKASPAPVPHPEETDPTVQLSREEKGTPAPPPLSASRAGGTVRIQLPRVSPETQAISLPELPEPPDLPPPPVPRLPETQEIPAAWLPPRREPPLPASAEPAPPSPPPLAPREAPPALLSPPSVPREPSPPPVPQAVPDPPPAPAPFPTPAPLPAPPEVGVDTIARPPEGKAVPVHTASPPPSRRLLWIALPVAVLLLVGVAVVLGLVLRGSPKPHPKPKPVAVKPVIRPPVVAPAPAPPPLPVHPQIALGETALGAGDMKGVKAALDAIPPADLAALRPDELQRYQALQAALAPLQTEQLASNLARGLERGDLRLLRAAESVSPAQQGTLSPEAQANLARARKALDLDSRLSRAQRAGNALEVIHQADALLAELPRASRARDQKERAASGIETAADAAIESGQYDAALNLLGGLKQAWPDRAGLPARLDRVAAERKADGELDGVLAGVARAERDNKPQEGLRLLAAAHPNGRYAARFQEARHRLDGEIAQLDHNPPKVESRGTAAEYEKGKAAVIQLRITDDLGVRKVEGWARPEGGTYVNLPLRHASGTDNYELDVPADVHQNKTVEYYVTATDGSDHTGQYGSADHPQKLKKKKNLLEKILGGRDKDGG